MNAMDVVLALFLVLTWVEQAHWRKRRESNLSVTGRQPLGHVNEPDASSEPRNARREVA
jgi:hypothetical protein